MDILLKLLKSKNPTAISIGVVLAFLVFIWIGFGVLNRANAYVGQFETKEEHKQDVETQVNNFRKDVRIALLENNKALLDEIEKRIRR